MEWMGRWMDGGRREVVLNEWLFASLLRFG
jgi:hypothetical protein